MNGLTTFRLKFLLQAPVTSLNENSEESFNGEGEFNQPQTQPQSQAPKPFDQFNQFQNDDSVCGIPVAGFTQSLVIGGQSAGHGEWFVFRL
jgi:phage repressor protein C with HTH and peptisase S24 domain